MPESQEYYNDVERRLVALLQSCSSYGTAAEIEWMREATVNNGEYGVALEELCAVLVEDAETLPDDIKAEIHSLGEKMRMHHSRALSEFAAKFPKSE